jgi:hypothetical protein
MTSFLFYLKNINPFMSFIFTFVFIFFYSLVIMNSGFHSSQRTFAMLHTRKDASVDSGLQYTQPLISLYIL